jgi:hypothetical protein
VPTIPVDAGVTVDLPAELTSLTAVEPALAQAWVGFTVATTPPGENPQLWFCRWPAVLFLLWSEDRVELWARDRPLLAAPLTLMAFPFTERDWQRFKVDARHAELCHEPSGTIFFDVHLRVKPVVVSPVAPLGPAPTPETVRRSRRPTKMVRRVELICDSEQRAGWPSQFAKQAIDRARDEALKRDDGEAIRLLTIDTPSQRYKTWEGVNAQRQAAPGTPVAETLRSLRLRK